MDLKELILSIDIVEYISQFVELEKKGEEYWGLSCFKDENTPSFSVRRNPPFFFDYSSGIGGNLYTFIKKYHRCSNKEAVEIIKKYAGYDGEIEIKDKRLTATAVCKRFARKESTKRPEHTGKFSNDYMERFEKRLDKLAVWLNEGISRESLDKFQVYYDGFTDRLVYPIRDLNGKIINVGGRTLAPNWKEQGLRKYTYFNGWEGGMDIIYGLYENLAEIKSKKEIILFEGCKSVLIADTWGVHNCGALLTSHLNEYQMKILAKLGCKVVFALDKDVNIRDDKRIHTLKRYVNCYYILDRNNLLDAKDSPVDKGREVFQKLYENRYKL